MDSTRRPAHSNTVTTGDNIVPSAGNLQSYAFITLDRLRKDLPIGNSHEHYLILSESQIVELRGFEISQSTNEATARFLSRPVVGAILDRDFIIAFPKAVARLRQIIVQIDGTDGIYDMSDGSANVVDWQLSRAFALSGRFLADLGAGHVETGRLQQIVEDQLSVLQEAQRLVDQAIPLQPLLGVFLPPSSASVRPSELRGVLSVSQNSKREFGAIHAFEIHVTEGDTVRGTSTVIVRLRAAHTQNSLATWTMPAHTIVAGWNRFDCPFVARALDEPVSIEIEWQPDAAPEFALTLGEITADPRLGLLRSDGVKVERPLALRVYAGTPGLRLPFHGWGRLPDGYPAFEQPSRVIIDELLAQAEYFGGLEEPRSELLRYIDQHSGLFLHPVDDGAHVAVIRNVRIDNVRAISSNITLAHDAAAETEFGLYAAPADMPVSLAHLSPNVAQRRWMRVGGTFSKPGRAAEISKLRSRAAWMRLRAHEHGQIVFEPDVALGNRFHIYLATRQAGGGTSHAMAHFLHLTAIRERR